MKIRFTKDHTGPYGIFVKGREVDLPPTMLATIPKDCYETKAEAKARVEAEAKAKAEAKNEGANEHGHGKTGNKNRGNSKAGKDSTKA